METDSRTHVEKLQVNIAHAVEQAGLMDPRISERIVVGIGPAPFTDSERKHHAVAKALAFATEAELVGRMRFHRKRNWSMNTPVLTRAI